MERSVRSAAVQMAVLVFFAMAIAGWLWRCSPGACAARAFGGAVAMYIVVMIAGRLVVKIIIHAMVDNQMRKQAERNKE